MLACILSIIGVHASGQAEITKVWMTDELKVEIVYNLVGEFDKYDIVVRVNEKGGNGAKWYEIKAVQGNVGEDVYKGNNRMITWDVLSEENGSNFAKYKNFEFEIKATGIPAPTVNTPSEPDNSTSNETTNEPAKTEDTEVTYSSGSYSRSRGFSMPSLSDLSIGIYGAYPYVKNVLFSSQYFDYPDGEVAPIMFVGGVNFMYPLDNDEFSVGVDMGYTGWNNLHSWNGTDTTVLGIAVRENASYTYRQFRVLARVNWNVSDNVYFGFGFGGKRLKETSVSSNLEYDGTNIMWKMASRICIGFRTDLIGRTRVSGEVGFGGGGLLLGGSYTFW